MARAITKPEIVWKATVEDLSNVPESVKAELVNGEIVVMSPTGYSPGRAAMMISLSLLEFERRTGLGHSVPDGVGFIVDLPHRKSFSPDAAFYIGKLSLEVKMEFLDGAPIFAAEVRSENDYGPAAEREMARKRADYFAAGTQVVWDVDLRSENVVRVYRHTAPQNPAIYQRGESAEAESALPGWTMPVDDLFR
jgi:Uma2 family endonuclease